jgi:flagellar biogenesis protein FliO
VSAPSPGPPRSAAGAPARPLAVPLTLGLVAALLLVFATVSWLQLVAALAMLGALALALSRLVEQQQPGE